MNYCSSMFAVIKSIIGMVTIHILRNIIINLMIAIALLHFNMSDLSYIHFL